MTDRGSLAQVKMEASKAKAIAQLRAEMKSKVEAKAKAQAETRVRAEMPMGMMDDAESEAARILHEYDAEWRPWADHLDNLAEIFMRR